MHTTCAVLLPILRNKQMSQVVFFFSHFENTFAYFTTWRLRFGWRRWSWNCIRPLSTRRNTKFEHAECAQRRKTKKVEHRYLKLCEREDRIRTNKEVVQCIRRVRFFFPLIMLFSLMNTTLFRRTERQYLLVLVVSLGSSTCYNPLHVSGKMQRRGDAEFVYFHSC